MPSAKFPDGSQAYRNSQGNYSYVGRVTVALTSSDPERVPLPPAVHIPRDSQSLTLPITTSHSVGRSRVLLTATHGDVTKRLRL